MLSPTGVVKTFMSVILSAAKDLLFLAPENKSRFFTPFGRSE
jgi:hypothetical protein